MDELELKVVYGVATKDEEAEFFRKLWCNK